MKARLAYLALALLVQFLLGGAATAHSIGVSRGDYRAMAKEVQVELTFARPEIAAALPDLDRDADGTLDDSEVGSGRARLAAAMLDGLQIRAAGQACLGQFKQARLTEEDGLAIGLTFECASEATELTLRMPLLESLSLGHRHLVADLTHGPALSGVLYEAQPELRIAGAVAANTSAAIGAEFFLLGIEHILTGYDHLVFLLGLILVGGGLRSLLVVVTAFTVAHSATLGLATVGVWTPSPNWVEPAIALSIAYVGVENWFVRDASRRWLLTFPFGLIHGFGFAGALQEVALPQAEIPLALVSFNVGVEAGQVAVLALVLPLLIWARKRAWFARYGVRAASSLIAVAGIAWFWERVA